MRVVSLDDFVKMTRYKKAFAVILRKVGDPEFEEIHIEGKLDSKKAALEFFNKMVIMRQVGVYLSALLVFTYGDWVILETTDNES